jgi:hypothetical protein
MQCAVPRTTPRHSISIAAPTLVTTGLDPVVHADRARGKQRSQRTMSSHKSRQFGLSERIRSIFHLRDQCLMFFSR